MTEMNDPLETGTEQETVLLPLFPLRMVLFPGQILPLHIFEPRYRVMINQCIAKEEPFGVVLMREETSDWRNYKEDVALPCPVGTTAHIRQVERLPDGRLNIVTMGLHRFRVQQLLFDLPYLQGEVEAFPLERSFDQDQVGDQMLTIRRLLSNYIDLLSKVMDAEIDLDEVPDDPRTVAYLAASALQLPSDDKQELLATPDLASLLKNECLLLSKETILLDFMQRTEDQLDERTMGPTGYLYPN
ncbi:MAG: LON peptidase substrate-binding domain-containing protein [Chloroflexota bacterium]|nr:LON peptidase substrate-binding domain-containing protein [Chloroflexota bacterium]